MPDTKAAYIGLKADESGVVIAKPDGYAGVLIVGLVNGAGDGDGGSVDCKVISGDKNSRRLVCVNSDNYMPTKTI
jgi:hypothetical protein